MNLKYTQYDQGWNDGYKAGLRDGQKFLQEARITLGGNGSGEAVGNGSGGLAPAGQLSVPGYNKKKLFKADHFA